MVEEFCESEIEGARIEWEKGVDGLRSRIKQMMADSEVREPVVRTTATFRGVLEQMSWRGKESRFAAFVQETMEGIEGDRECSSGEELAQVHGGGNNGAGGEAAGDEGEAAGTGRGSTI